MIKKWCIVINCLVNNSVPAKVFFFFWEFHIYGVNRYKWYFGLLWRFFLQNFGRCFYIYTLICIRHDKTSKIISTGFSGKIRFAKPSNRTVWYFSAMFINRFYNATQQKKDIFFKWIHLWKDIDSSVFQGNFFTKWMEPSV